MDDKLTNDHPKVESTGTSGFRESKIVAMDRLRREGRWAEASAFKDRTVKELRAEGVKRGDARELAWERMLEAYPPLPPAEPAPEPEPVEAKDEWGWNELLNKWGLRLFDAAIAAVKEWQQQGVILSDDDRAAICQTLVCFWAMGFKQKLPRHDLAREIYEQSTPVAGLG